MSQALAKTEQVSVLAQVRQNPITAITQQYDKLAQVANVCFPATALDNMPPMHKPSPTVIRVDTAAISKDTYQIPGSDQLGLSKHVLLKMLTAAGCSWRTRKLTTDSDLDNIRWVAEIWRRLPDGTFQQGQGSKAWSWQKCLDDFVRKAVQKPKQSETEAQAEQRGKKNALQYREFADEQTETKALLRAARAILNIKTSYAAQELQKPFLFLKVVPDLDVNDPEIKRMLAQRLVDSTFALYPQSENAPALPAFPEPSAEPTTAEFDEDESFGDLDGDDSARNSDQGETPDLGYDPFAESVPVGPPCCGVCGKAIVDSAAGERTYTASQIVDLTTDHTGGAKCLPCYAAWKQDQKGGAS